MDLTFHSCQIQSQSLYMMTVKTNSTNPGLAVVILIYDICFIVKKGLSFINAKKLRETENRACQEVPQG